MTEQASGVRDLARVVGLDVARALALLGMFATHVGDADAWPWLEVFHGRSAALFALLAGVTMAVMLARRSTAPTAMDVRFTRVKITTRAVLLIMFSWFLTAFGTPVDVILDNLGVMMLLALPALRWRPAITAGVGFGFLIAGYWIVGGLQSVLPEVIYDLPVLHELWSTHYPALAWVGYVLVGMAVGHLAPWKSVRPLIRLAVAGVALTVFAIVTSNVAARVFTVTNTREEARRSGPFSAPDWTSLEPHRYTPFETLSNVGVAFVVIAACVALTHHAPRLVWPLAATGSMTLTLYSAHILVIAMVGEEMVWKPSNLAFVVLCAASILFASLWRWKLGQGPLERGVSITSRAAARAATRRASLQA